MLRFTAEQVADPMSYFNAMRKLNHTGVAILTDFAPVLVRHHGRETAVGFVARLTDVVRLAGSGRRQARWWSR